jgi:sigma-B regulation protein RsbU (phosphoserine phosphatase)
MSEKTAAESQNKTAVLQCLEITGGNQRVSYPLELPGLTGWLHSEPTEQSLKGGDVHYVSLCSKGLLTRLALADVSGHGPSASDTAVVLRNLIHKHIDTWDQSELMRELNNSLNGTTTNSEYASALLFAYYQPTGELVFTNAGHPPALWCHAATKTWDWLEASTPLAHNIEGLPLGIIEGTDYTQTAVQVQQNDLLLLYTDGITEARNANGDMLEREGLLSIVQSIGAETAAQLADQLIARLNEFRQGAVPDDDHTFCILQSTSAPSAD